jgi:predicted nucleic acid-binding protein
MPDYFFDTSALGKNYHNEAGTPKVEQLLKDPSDRHFISRLSVIEIQSVFAGKVRAGVISESDFRTLRRRFLTDIATRRVDVVRLTGFHYQEAERLIRKQAMSYSLRTLDAIQLSVALDLRVRGLSNHFVCADRNLCKVAVSEGLTVINPEIP